MPKRSLSTLLSAIALTAAAALSVPTTTVVAAPSDHAVNNSSAKSQHSNNVYIVRLAGSPVTAYKGGIKGYAATKPAKGRKIDPNSPRVVNYMSYLTARHDAVLGAAGGGKKVYDYGYVFNGFAAELTDAQAAKIKLMPGVLSVEKNEFRTLDTSNTPNFLGLTGASGFYATTGAKGENVIIGIVDGGVWPESLSFSDRTGTNGNASKDGKLSYLPIPGWHGKCTPGEQFNAGHCNQKLIGARYYNAGFGGNAGINAELPHEFNSPRDFGGHGTHTASTAGGNAAVPTTQDATPFGATNGIAPRARIAAYKVCWQFPAGGSCTTVDSVAAIDQAVADGVDVINFSISGSRTIFNDSVEIAFLFAADAGVFVAASAGNSGPAISTVAHGGPWLTTVAAGTHNRGGEGSVTLGNGVTYLGGSFATPLPSAPLINSADAGLPGADPDAVALCFTPADNETFAGEEGPVLDPAKVAGKIVVCDRGVNARINKSLAVLEAGGVGTILVNTSANSVNADFHFVPTVHLSHLDRPAVTAYAATAGATASIGPSTIVFNVPAPTTAAFSSRGPLLAGAGDLLKPDVMAPGQDILASVAPPGNHGRDFDMYSGTSMSSPHVAGLAALLRELHPTWSPMAIKSALMTSATSILDGGPTNETNPVVLFREGAGHVDPNAAANPGLVYDHSFNDWLAFLCGTSTAVGPATCSALQGLGFSLDPSDLNTASIAIGNLAGVQKVTRKVTNVGSGPATYNASLVAGSLPGFSTAISPSQIQLNPGQTAKFDVTFTRSSAPINAYAGGFLTWTEQGGASRTVRIPVVVQPVALAAPAQVSGTGGPISYNVTFGYDGAFSATPRGLVAAQTTSATVIDDPTDSTCSLTSPNAYHEVVAIPAGTTHARFSLFDEFTDGNDDLDMCVFNAANTQVGASAGGTSAEEVNLLNPAAGNYTVVVQGWGTDGPDAQFTLFKWALGSTAAGNMTVTAPAAAVTGGTGTITLDFTPLTPGTKYLGSVAYSGIAGLPNPTIVRVDP
jgi:subtilisin family serine protease